MCWQRSTDELRAFDSSHPRLIETIANALGLLPKQRVAICGTSPGRRAPWQLKYRFTLSASHPVSPDDEFGDRHPEPPIDEVAAIFPQDHDVILLPQIPDNVLNQC